ncbi:cupin domain-containing protein [Butyrivibrio sp. WCD3002]|uniref:cupin domain-containing protein n=1 Tax=Butyrivibrio sp. WCD3002 TaxID=1280676 RepID=UPI00041F324B|nr:cupin domain-containing protein [Butyrivibrio sp. WCD3002]
MLSKGYNGIRDLNKKEDRPLAGSIYFLLTEDEISHFHQIDCEEIWYHHEGCAEYPVSCI